MVDVYNKDYLWKEKSNVTVTVINDGSENGVNINFFGYDLYCTSIVCLISSPHVEFPK